MKIYAGLVNGDLMPIIEDRTSEEIVTAFTGDDTGAPSTSVTIEVITESRSKVKFTYQIVQLRQVYQWTENEFKLQQLTDAEVRSSPVSSCIILITL
ncbi:hypothetical protein ACVXG7_02950 [Enterobacter hormaechei]